MLRVIQILNTSVIASLLNHLYGLYCRTEQRIGDVYQNSWTYRLISGFWQSIGICFKFSFLGRITEIREEENAGILDNSRAVRYLIGCYGKYRDKVIYYLNTSKAVGSTKETREEFYLSPVKTAGIIAVVAIVANVALSIVLRINIGLWGRLMRALLLFAGISGLFCSAGWSTIKNSSVIFRLLSKK